MTLSDDDGFGGPHGDRMETMRELSFAVALLRRSHRFHQDLLSAVAEHGGREPNVPALVERLGSLLRDNAHMEQQVARFIARFDPK